MKVPLFLAVVLLAAGCASSLATLQPATVVPKYHLQGVAAVEGSLPIGGITRTIDTANDLSKRISSQGGMLSQDDIDQMLNATLGLLLTPPAIGPEFQGGFGIYDRTEVDLRYALGTWRIGARYQFLGAPTGLGWAATVGVGGARYVFGASLTPEIEQLVKIDDFTRWELDIPVTLGYSGRFVHFWFGPKVLFTHFGSALRLCRDYDSNAKRCNQFLSATFDGSARYIAGQLGVAIGYRWVWLALELTFARASSDASGSVSDGMTTQQRTFYPTPDIILYPALGIIFRI